MGFGGSPVMGGLPMRLSGSPDGAEASSACVYGCRGSPYTSSTGPPSTIFPKYITTTQSLRYSITFRSWEMKI